jgi:hypothetical protein
MGCISVGGTVGFRWTKAKLSQGKVGTGMLQLESNAGVECALLFGTVSAPCSARPRLELTRGMQAALLLLTPWLHAKTKKRLLPAALVQGSSLVVGYRLRPPGVVDDCRVRGKMKGGQWRKRSWRGERRLRRDVQLACVPDRATASGVHALPTARGASSPARPAAGLMRLPPGDQQAACQPAYQAAEGRALGRWW